MSMTGIEMADPNDINLLNQLDQLLAASGSFFRNGKTVVDGTATTLVVELMQLLLLLEMYYLVVLL